MQKRELLHSVCGNINQYIGKAMKVHKKLKIKLLHNSAISCLGMYPKKLKSVSLLFTAGVFTAASRGNQPKCPQMAEENMVDIHHGVRTSQPCKWGNSVICKNTGNLVDK